MSDLMLDVGQANELKLAFRRAGFTNDDVKWLCEGTTLAEVRKLRLGQSEIKPTQHLIDCDTSPFTPEGWKVEEHKKQGQLAWGAYGTFLADGQRGGKWIKGNMLRKELECKPTMNANVLDYLLANTHLIPEEWKGKYVFFWGTIYRYADGGPYVRSLHWDDDRWDWNAYWLGSDWDDGHPAVLRAS